MFVDPVNTPGVFCCWVVPVPYQGKMESLESHFSPISSDLVWISVGQTQVPRCYGRVTSAATEVVF